MAAKDVFEVAEVALKQQAQHVPNVKFQRMTSLNDIDLPCEQNLKAKVSNGYVWSMQPRAAVPVNIFCGQQRLQTRHVWFSATAINQGWVFVRTQRKGDLMANCEIRKGDVDLLRGASLQPPSAIQLQAKLGKDVAAGAAYSIEQLQTPSMINAGDKVMAQFRQGSIGLSVPAHAVGNGNVGEKIKIRIESPAQIRTARVVTNKEVHIEY